MRKNESKMKKIGLQTTWTGRKKIDKKDEWKKKDRWIERANSRPTNIRPALAFEEDVEDILRSVSHVTWTAWRKTRTSIGMWRTRKCKNFVLKKKKAKTFDCSFHLVWRTFKKPLRENTFLQHQLKCLQKQSYKTIQDYFQAKVKSISQTSGQNSIPVWCCEESTNKYSHLSRTVYYKADIETSGDCLITLHSRSEATTMLVDKYNKSFILSDVAEHKNCIRHSRLGFVPRQSRKILCYIPTSSCGAIHYINTHFSYYPHTKMKQNIRWQKRQNFGQITLAWSQ